MQVLFPSYVFLGIAVIVAQAPYLHFVREDPSLAPRFLLGFYFTIIIKFMSLYIPSFYYK